MEVVPAAMKCIGGGWVGGSAVAGSSPVVCIVARVRGAPGGVDRRGKVERQYIKQRQPALSATFSQSRTRHQPPDD